MLVCCLQLAPEEPIWGSDGLEAGEEPSLPAVYALVTRKPHEAAGSQASLSWVGRRMGFSVGGFWPKYVPHSTRVKSE